MLVSGISPRVTMAGAALTALIWIMEATQAGSRT